jgi:hypothetical protein
MSSRQSQDEQLRQSQEKGHEIRDARFSNVFMFGFGMIVLVVMAGIVIAAVVYKMTGWFENELPPPPQFQAQTNELPPQPRIEVQGRRDLNEFRAAEEQQLNSYGWVNKDQGIIRIPIDQAMRIIAEKGLPQNPAGGTGSPGKK